MAVKLKKTSAATPDDGEFKWPYGRKNYIVFGAALVVIILGYIALGQPPVDGFLSLTLAPILLVVGYCVLIPLALILKDPAVEAAAETPSDTAPDA